MNKQTRVERYVKGLIVLGLSLLSTALACLLMFPVEPLVTSEYSLLYLPGTVLACILAVWITLCLISLILSICGVFDCVFPSKHVIFWKWNDQIYRMLDASIQKLKR